MKEVRHNITQYEDNKHLPCYPINVLELHELIMGDYIEQTYEQSYLAIQKGDYEI